MHNINAIVKLVCLTLLDVGLAFGQNMIYHIMSPNCGNVYAQDAFKKSLSLRPYGLTMENKSSLVFDLKTNSDASIFATDTQTSNTANNIYRFVIGSYGNTKMELQEIRNGQWTGLIKIDGSLNPAVFQTFWFSWENGEIQAGQGAIVGQSTLMAWTDPNPFSVHGVGITTCWGATGEWKINVDVDYKFGGHFNSCQRSNLKSELPITAHYLTSKMACAKYCSTENTCFGFNYQLSNNRCELLSSGNEPVTSIMRRDLDGWKFYPKCYDGNTVCAGCYF